MLKKYSQAKLNRRCKAQLLLPMLKKLPEIT